MNVVQSIWVFKSKKFHGGLIKKYKTQRMVFNGMISKTSLFFGSEGTFWTLKIDLVKCLNRIDLPWIIHISSAKEKGNLNITGILEF